MNKYIKLIFMSSILALASCANTQNKSEQESKESVEVSDNGFSYYDQIERPEIDEPEVIGGYLTLPERVTYSGSDSEVASINTYVASDDSYNVDLTGECPKITYEEVKDWQYIYATVKDYSVQYSNFRITLNTKGAEKIAIQAIYEEIYTENMKPVTVFTGDLMDGDQYVVAELGRYRANDYLYQPVSSKPLEECKILGFIILIDSNPVQKVLDKAGEVNIKEFEFLQDGDEKLDTKHVVPRANLSTAASSANGYDLEYDSQEETLHVYYTSIQIYSMLYIPIVNMNKDYCEFEIKLNTVGVTNYSIGVVFSNEGHEDWQPYVDLVKQENVSNGEHTHTINFDGTSPISTQTWDYVSGELIKNYNVYQICLWFDSLVEGDFSGEAFIESIEFERTAAEGCVVGKAWSSTSSSIRVHDDVLVGGSGTIDYDFYKDWFHLAMPVSGYTTCSHLTIQVMGEIGHFGIEVVANGSPVTILSGWDKIALKDNEVDNSDSDANGSVVSITKDSKNVYTLDFDFTNAKKSIVTGLAFYEKTITSLRFYLNDPNEEEPFDGSRTIKFVSIAFSE